MTYNPRKHAETTFPSRRITQNISLTFQNNQVILDIPDTDRLSKKEHNDIIRDLNNLLVEEEKITQGSMTLAEKIDFYLKKRSMTPLLFRDIEVVTRINREVHSISRFQIDGDIEYIEAKPRTGKNQDNLNQIHQVTVQLYLKNWRNSVIQYGEIIRAIINTITWIQAWSSLLGVLVFLAGRINHLPKYQVLSIIPFFITGIMTCLKKRI